MKKIRQRLIAIALMFSLMAGIFAVPAQAATKNKYWLEGISKAAGGNLKMYYGEDALRLKGKCRKASSQNGLSDAAEKKRSCTVKVADNCKVIQVEADNARTISYAKWAEQNSYEDGDVVSFISATILVKNKKIIKIYFSA